MCGEKANDVEYVGSKGDYNWPIRLETCNWQVAPMEAKAKKVMKDS